MSSSFQNEIPKARVNLKLDLHTGGARKKVELPLKLLVAGDFSNGQEERPLSERVKTDINKNNFNDVLADISPFRSGWKTSISRWIEVRMQPGRCWVRGVVLSTSRYSWEM